MPRTSLCLTRGPLRWSMLDRPVSIGRLPDCDVIVASDQVSRVHAYVVPTPDGLLLVDRSRHGTLINGERMRAPWLLAEGDTVQIGSALLRVEQALAEAGEAAPIPAFRARLRIWLRRYGPSEVLGTVAAVGAATAIMDATGKTVVAAYAGTLAETVVFYGIMILRDAIREAHQAGKRGKPYGSRDLIPLLRNIMLEFGVAEALDSFVIRPFCIGVGMRYLSSGVGALVGKLVSDLAFYGPVLTIFEWRLAHRTARDFHDRRRRTTATTLPKVEAE